MKTTNTAMGCNLLIWLYSIITWIINLIKFVNCDFTEPWKDEIVHGLGVFIPPVSWVTAWL
jgi:hypothetical protein